MTRRILIVDDEERVCALIEKYARQEGYDTARAMDGQEALRLCRGEKFDLVILDVMLPGGDGFHVCRSLRRFSDAPVLMLSARSESYDRIKGLEAGADDYMAKPFSPRELMLRVAAILRRGALPAEEKELLVFDGLVIDRTAHQVYVDEQPVALSPKGFHLLLALASRPGVAVTRQQLMDAVWRESQSPRSLDTHIKQLRQALSPRGDLIQTVWGVGYRFNG